jgi:hypothetical protein
MMDPSNDTRTPSRWEIATFIQAAWIGFGIGFLVSFWMGRITDEATQIAWPLAAVVIAVLVRPHAVSLLRRLESLEGRGIKAKFRDEFAEFKMSFRSSKDLLEDASASGQRPSTEEYALKRLAAELPAAAILESWIRIEESLHDLAKARGRSDLIHRSSISPVLSWAQSEAILSDDAFGVLRHLRNLRNISVHATGSERSSITYDQATEAIDAALRIASIIREKSKLPDEPSLK